jgi:hypothetical protein
LMELSDRPSNSLAISHQREPIFWCWSMIVKSSISVHALILNAVFSRPEPRAHDFLLLTADVVILLVRIGAGVICMNEEF